MEVERRRSRRRRESRGWGRMGVVGGDGEGLAIGGIRRKGEVVGDAATV